MTATGTGDSLTFTATVPATAGPAELVEVQLKLSNVSTRPVEVHLQGRETVFDVIVLDASGREIWRRLDGQSTLSILQLRPLAAGETIEFRALWTQMDRAGARVPPGEYQVVGVLPNDSPTPLRTAPARVRVTPDKPTVAPG